MSAQMQSPPVRPGDLIAEYLWLRDNRRAQEKAFEEFIRDNYATRMAEIERDLLDFLQQTGGQNFSDEETGTAFKTTKVSVSTSKGGDALAFRRHVIGTEDWDLVDWRPNRTAIKAMVARGENPGDIGVNYSEFETVGVRRKGEKD